MLYRALAQGEGGIVPWKHITRIADRASATMAEVEEDYAGSLTERQSTVMDVCQNLLARLTQYDKKAVGTNLRALEIPRWDGHFFTLGRHLETVQRLTAGLQDEETKLLHLKSSLPPNRLDMIASSNTYSEATLFLKEFVEDPAGVALGLKDKFMTIQRANTMMEEEAAVTKAVEWLGRARQAHHAFYLHHHECARALAFMKDPVALHMELKELGKIKEKEKILQGTESPNMACAMHKFLLNLQLQNQANRAAMGSAPGWGASTAAAAFQLKGGGAGKAGGGGAGGGAKGGSIKELFSCTHCNSTLHNEKQWWKCFAFLMCGSPSNLPDWLCIHCCCKKSVRCQEKRCYQKDGVVFGFRCLTCSRHKNLGNCVKCVDHQKELKPRLQKQVEAAKKAPKQNAQAMCAFLSGGMGDLGDIDNLVGVSDVSASKGGDMTANMLVVNDGPLGHAVTTCEVLPAVTADGEHIYVSRASPSTPSEAGWR
jgi:hypothetical protein